MTIDLNAIKWSKIFRDGGMEWPDLLHKETWDKKKGKMLAALKSTGIGAQLKKCEEDFKKLKMYDYIVGGRNPKEAREDVDRRIAPFVNGSAMKTLHDDLKELKDLATKQAAEIKKNKLIPSSSRKLVEDIAEGAETLMVFCNTNTLSGFLEKALKDRIEELNSNQRGKAGFSTQQAKGVGRKVQGVIAQIRENLKGDPLDPANVKTAENELFTASRDMSQPLVNFLKSVEAGVTFENFNKGAAQRLGQLLVPYSDGDKYKLQGLDRQAIEAKLAEVEKISRAYDILVDPIKHVG